MADEGGFKIKGAASRDKEAKVSSTVDTPNSKASSHSGQQEDELEEGEHRSEAEDNSTRYRWCKCVCDPAQYGGQDHYFLHLDTRESSWEEPNEPYWLWDAEKQALNSSGLQQPAQNASPSTKNAADPDYSGYNPKIHGNYDPNAPYAQYHEKKAVSGSTPHITMGDISVENAAYSAVGNFNRFTGAYQTEEQTSERHNDYNKTGRQMNAYFDVDAAANAHDGRSLKEERRNEKLSKKQIKELAEKRRAKKEKKRMEFYKS